MIKLRNYQTDAVKTIIDKSRSGVTRQLVSLPTGCGKTIAFAELVRLMDCKTLVIAHTTELIEQAAQKIKMVMGANVGIGICKAESKAINR